MSAPPRPSRRTQGAHASPQARPAPRHHAERLALAAATTSPTSSFLEQLFSDEVQRRDATRRKAGRAQLDPTMRLGSWEDRAQYYDREIGV